MWLSWLQSSKIGCHCHAHMHGWVGWLMATDVGYWRMACGDREGRIATDGSIDHVDTRTCLHIPCAHTCTCICIHAHKHARMDRCLHSCMDARMRMHACTHARMHVCTYASLDGRMHTGGSERTDVGDGGRTRWIGDTLAGEHPIAVPTHPSVHACTRTTAEWRTLAHRRLTIAGLGLM